MFEMIRSRHAGERIWITLANTEQLLAEKMVEIVYQGKTLLEEDELNPMKNLLSSLGLDISTEHCQTIPGPSVQETDGNPFPGPSVQETDGDRSLRVTRYSNSLVTLFHWKKVL
jgi:hypothetical protein